MSYSPWGQLVCTSDISTEPVEIATNKFIIGRSKCADLCLFGNKLVSGTHCFIEKDCDGKVWLQDTSTNGTLLNFHQKLVGIRKELQHGDEIHVIYRKSEEHLTVSYMYQDLSELATEEEDLTEEYTDDTETSQTLPGDESPLRKRHRTDFSDDETLERPVEKKSKSACLVQVEDTTDDPTQESEESVSSNGSRKSRAEADNDEQDIIETAPQMETAFCKVTSKSVSSTGTKIEEGNKKPDDTESASKPEAAKSDDGMEESLMCIICQEILHDCVSCQPCMHTFCGGCYSDWMKRSNECPSCRVQVKQVGKNHMVNNLVEIYLKAHPDKQRSEADLKELDAKNVIKSKTVKLRAPERTVSDLMDEDSFYDSGDDDVDDEDDERDYENSEDASSAPIGRFGYGTGLASPFGGGALFGRAPVPFTGMTGPFGVVRPPRTMCRQCPGYKDPFAVSPIVAATTAVSTALAKVAAVVTGGGTGDGPGTSAVVPKTDEDIKVMPIAPKFVCAHGQTHILCSCCLVPMPDRRMTSMTTVPKIACSLCHRAFCHLYWGCRKTECLGCLGQLKEMNFGKKILSNIVLENTYESDVLKNYLEHKGITTKALLSDCCDQMKTGAITAPDQIRGLNPNSTVCYACGLRNFREMAYQYRKNIKADELPAPVTSRPDCYWGKNCRTQKNKMGHAVKFNHICEQTRT